MIMHHRCWNCGFEIYISVQQIGLFLHDLFYTFGQLFFKSIIQKTLSRRNCTSHIWVKDEHCSKDLYARILKSISIIDQTSANWNQPKRMHFMINCFIDWSQRTFAAACSALKKVFKPNNVKSFCYERDGGWSM